MAALQLLFVCQISKCDFKIYFLISIVSRNLIFRFLILLVLNLIVYKINGSCTHFVERSMAEDLLKAPSVNIDHSASVKPVLMWSSNATKKVSNASGGPSRFVKLGLVHLRPSGFILREKGPTKLRCQRIGLFKQPRHSFKAKTQLVAWPVQFITGSIKTTALS